MTKFYEIIWEVFNKCANNQMRDIFIEEAEVDDTDTYVRNKIKDPNLKWEKSILSDGSIVYDLDASGIKERISFTEI